MVEMAGVWRFLIPGDGRSDAAIFEPFETVTMEGLRHAGVERPFAKCVIEAHEGVSTAAKKSPEEYSRVFWRKFSQPCFIFTNSSEIHPVFEREVFRQTKAMASSRCFRCLERVQAVKPPRRRLPFKCTQALMSIFLSCSLAQILCRVLAID